MSKDQKGTLLLAAASVGALLAARSAVKRWREYDMRGKTVLITGGSRGLGLLLARELAQQGAHLAICARDEAELRRARADLANYGGPRVMPVKCDVTDRAQVKEMVERVTETLGGIDVLINNAGLIQVGPLEVMTLEDYEEAMRTHFWAPLYTILAVLPQMRRRQEGRIVNISSVGGKIAVPHLLPYSASKFALVGLSTGLRTELAKDNIVVTTVSPGLIRTGSPRNATFKGKHKEEYAWFSIGDSLPLTSMSANRAARQIIAACQRGDADIVLSIQAQLAVKFSALFPNVTADMLALVNRFLPKAGGIGIGRRKGKESESDFSPSLLTALSDAAAQSNNQMN